MAKNRQHTDGVYTQYYADHLSGGQARYRVSPQKESAILLQRMYWRVLTELSLNRFKWHGLPESVDERFLELSLMRHGGTLFFWYETPDLGGRYLVQEFTGVGKPNHYDNPTKFRVVSSTNVRGDYTPRDAVPIWGNYLRQPDNDIVMVYTKRLSDLDTTVDVNTINMRRPRVLVYDEDSQLTMANFDRQVQEGMPAIKVNSMTNPQQAYGSLDTGSHHETIPALLAAKGKMWNDALMMLGVATANQDKKERMITGEVEAGHDQSEVIRNIALNSREQACEQINTIFPDLDVSVEWRADEEQQQVANQQAQMLGLTDPGEPDNGVAPQNENEE